jgi:hypothetical protein
MIIHRINIIVPLVLLMAVAAMGQAGIVKAWDGFHHGYDMRWNSYQEQQTDQRVINYINIWGNNNYVDTDTRLGSNQGQQGPIPPLPGPEP